MKKNDKESSGTRERPGNQYVQMTRRQAVGWICAFMFLLVWIFILGVMVGRGTSPVRFDIDKLQKDFAELKAEVLKKEKTITKNRSDELLKKEDFAFHRELIAPDELPKSQAEKKAVVAKKKKPVVKTVKKRADKKPSKPAQKKETVSVSGGYALQIASLKEVKHADALVKKLKNKGYSAYYIAVSLPGKGVWYRVRIGPLKSKTKALAVLKNIKKDHKGAMLVKR
ncbi:MAG: SPOR domain-containing protein [Deltaproteobacteria bacterium]|nr:SPOR domain-containing protein [Deltaproteobacteria bacterium]